MRQIRSATAGNLVPMPPGSFRPHRHLRVTPGTGALIAWRVKGIPGA